MSNEDVYIIPENFAQAGYVKSFKIVNVIEAIAIAVLFGAVFYFIPIKDNFMKIVLYIIITGFPVLISLNGISGDCLTKTLLNFIRYRKKAKVFGPPSDVYRKNFNRDMLLKQFKEQKLQKKNQKKQRGKNRRKRGDKQSEEKQ